MSIREITDRVNHLGHAWEQFKHINDTRLNEIERKGHSDPLHDAHLDKISTALDNYKKRLDRIETAYDRPDVSHKDDSGIVPEHKSAYSKAFCGYLRKGMDASLEQIQSKALSVGTDSDGGYLVTPTMSSKIIQTVFETSPMRQLASVESISTDALDLIDDHTAAVAGWTTETGSVSETATPTLAKKNIPTHELYAQPKATQKLVDDAAIDIESWLSEKISDIFSRTQNTAFITGNGANKPRGILNYTAGTAWGQIQQLNSGTNGVVTSDALIQLFYSLKDEFSRRASFLMNRSTVQAVRLLKQTSTGQYMWQPGLAAGTPDTLLGVPVYMASDMPVAATGSLSVAVADFKSAYQIVDRIGIRILRDPYTEKPFVKFYATARVGGDVINTDAIKLMKLSA